MEDTKEKMPVCSACNTHPAEPGNIYGYCTACDAEHTEPPSAIIINLGEALKRSIWPGPREHG